MNSKIIAFVFAAAAFAPTIVLAGGGNGFTPLVGIPNLQDQTNFNSYINALYAMAISIAALIAVIKIIIAGAKYMLDDIVTHKSEAKEDIKNSLIGLLIIIGAVIILTTINSNLTNTSINAEGVAVNDVIPPIERRLNDYEKLCSDALSEGTSCANYTCSSLHELRGVFGVELNRIAVTCSEICNKIKDGVFFAETLTCGVKVSEYYNSLNNYKNEISEGKCPEGIICEVQFCTDESNNFCVEGDDLTTVTEEGSCTNVGGVFINTSPSACVIPKRYAGSNNVNVLVGETYKVNDPADTSLNLEEGANHGEIIEFIKPLQYQENTVRVKVKGVEQWLGCGNIQPNVCS